jgi:hypothetical protein
MVVRKEYIIHIITGWALDTHAYCTHFVNRVQASEIHFISATLRRLLHKI